MTIRKLISITQVATGSKYAFFELGLAIFGLVHLTKLEALTDMAGNNHPINQFGKTRFWSLETASQ